MVPDNELAPELSPEQKTNAELIKRIRKLRWIGMDEKADLLLIKLRSSGIVPAHSVIASPRETDCFRSARTSVLTQPKLAS